VIFCPGSNRSNRNPSGGFYLIAYDSVRTLVFKWFSLWTDKKSLFLMTEGLQQVPGKQQLAPINESVK
jgi:hypothetical protein